ncbi:MAG: hypothetical protein KKA42_03630 [candidate division Zixibacteria bacterium]|nr:hypothetical protein [candidate division Zixibacteria bacterium]
MDINFIYSGKDPRQTEALNFLQRYVAERGILANIVEADEEVSSPTVVINGRTLADKRTKPRSTRKSMYPSIKDIAEALEHELWSL